MGKAKKTDMNNPPKKTKTHLTRQIGEFATVEDFTKHGLGLIVDATKAVNTFPAGASRDLYSAYPTFGKVVESQSNRILGIISSVLKQQNIKGNIQRRQQDEQVELLLECNDVMLERVNSNLDDIAGIKRNPETILVETILPNAVVNTPNKSAGSWNTTKRPEASPSQQSTRLLTAKNTARPQVNFKVPVDNSAANPFIPKIKDKPNSLKPLAVLPEYDDDGMIGSYLHPYEFELSKFAPAKDQLTKVVAKKPQDIEKTPLVHVADEQKLKSLLYDLRNVQEFAVDLEHHSYRTFQGITCLMQISTRHKDYIIDALALREDLHILNEVFTHPKILKIFHGALSDIEWLQRDLSLYVVNMFDTSQAAKLIGLPRLSLAYLLKHYCNIEADKTFQLADWRIRPLPEQLISYARQDTHYLIYIYEMLRNELLSQANGETNLLITAYKQSIEICKRRYQKPRILADSHLDIYRKSKRLFDNRQLFALKEIFAWRDKIARLDDESYGYVLPNHMMLQISESLPREMQGILACCNPIPPLVRQNLHILHQIVLKAREQPIVKPIIDEDIVNRVVTTISKDVNGKLHCPHDLSRNPEFRDDLPTLLGENRERLIDSTVGLSVNPIISVFDTPPSSEDENIQQKLSSLRKVNFVSPYERYKAAIPFAEQQRIEELEKQTAINNTKLLCPIKSEPMVIKAEIKQESNDPYKMPELKNIKRKREEKSSSDDDDESVKETKTDVKKIRYEEDNTKERVTESDEVVMQDDSMGNDNSALFVEDKIAENISHRKKNFTNGNNFKKGKGRKKYNNNKTGQSSNQSVDYTKTDFTKFKGGSEKSRGTDIQSNFSAKRGQNNKVNNKKFNKLFTFSTSANKKK